MKKDRQFYIKILGILSIMLLLFFLIWQISLLVFSNSLNFINSKFSHSQASPTITPYLFKDIYKNSCADYKPKQEELFGKWIFENTAGVPKSVTVPNNWIFSKSGDLQLNYLSKGVITDFHSVGKWEFDYESKQLKLLLEPKRLNSNLSKPISTVSVPITIRSSFNGKCLFFFTLGEFTYGKIPTK